MSALKAQLRNSPRELEGTVTSVPDVVRTFSETLVSIGGVVVECADHAALKEFVTSNYPPDVRMFSTYKELANDSVSSGLKFETVELVVLAAHFGVAENGSVWVTDAVLPHRVLPFITQHLILVVDRAGILPTMNDAYDNIGASDYAFGTFIAGPSKTGRPTKFQP